MNPQGHYTTWGLPGFHGIASCQFKVWPFVCSSLQYVSQESFSTQAAWWPLTCSGLQLSLALHRRLLQQQQQRGSHCSALVVHLPPSLLRHLVRKMSGGGNFHLWHSQSEVQRAQCSASLSSCLHLSHEVAQYLLCLRFGLRTMARTCNGSLPASSTVSQSGWPSFVHICMKDDHTYIAFFLFVIALVTLKGRHPSAIRQLAKCSQANDMLTRTKNAGMTRKDYDEFLGRCWCMKYCKIATNVTQQCYPILDKAVFRRGRLEGKFAEV